MGIFTKLYIGLFVLFVILWLSMSKVCGGDYTPAKYYHHPAYDYSLKTYKQCQWVFSYHGHGVAVSEDMSHFIRDGKRYRIILPEGLRWATTKLK